MILIIYYRAGTQFSPVRHDQLVLVPESFLFDKRLYPLFLSRVNTSNVGVNSKQKKADVTKIFVQIIV
jgi:hypothetical protein